METTGPKWLYLHGFGSGPASTKGVALSEHFARLGIGLERLDLRRPSLEHLRLSVMMETVRAAIGSERDRAVIFGSSLGGLTAARVAEEDPRVCALVLLAPAFRFPDRWRPRLGDEGMKRWRELGWIDIQDYAERRTARVDFGFYEDLCAIETRSNGWPDVRVPVLVLHGRHDSVVDIELSRTWAAGKRHVRVVELDDGHELTLSIPRIASEAEAFLQPFLAGA